MRSEQWASEDKLAVALTEVVQKCDELQVSLLLIGAFAVRAYARRRRLTTDIDFVASHVDQNNLAALFKALDYDFTPTTKFGGIRATKYVAGDKVQLDVNIDAVCDEGSGSTYVIPVETFAAKAQVSVEPLQGGTGVLAYAIPPEDLLVLKLMAGRDQDAADAIALILDVVSDQVTAAFKDKVRQANLTPRINARLAEVAGLDDRVIRGMMVEHSGGRLTAQELSTVRAALRKLRT